MIRLTGTSTNLSIAFPYSSFSSILGNDSALPFFQSAWNCISSATVLLEKLKVPLTNFYLFHSL